MNHKSTKKLSKEPIYIFWHTFLSIDCKEKFIHIIQRQIFTLRSSKLINNAKEINITASPYGAELIKDAIISAGLHYFLPKFKFFLKKDPYHEYVTLSKIKEISDKKISKNQKGFVLYFHTKGSSFHPYYQQYPIDSWTKMMEFFNLTYWQNCVKILEKYFTCGCEMWSLSCSKDINQKNIFPSEIKGEFWHYSGNFWWSRMDYIANYLYPPSFFSDGNFEIDRKLSEYWILSSIGIKTSPFEHYPLHFTGQKYKRGIIHHYLDIYPKKYYRSGGQTPIPKLKRIFFSGEVGQPYIFISKFRTALNLIIFKLFGKKIWRRLKNINFA